MTDLLALIEDLERDASDCEPGDATTVAPDSTPGPRRAPPPTESGATRVHLRPPVGWRPEIVSEIEGDLRVHGVVSSGRGVELLRVLSTTVTADESGRRSASCLIHALARRAGLEVIVVDDPVDWPDDSVASQREGQP